MFGEPAALLGRGRVTLGKLTNISKPLKVWSQDQQHQRSLGTCLKMHILSPHPRPTESGTRGQAQKLVLTGDSVGTEA